MKSAWLKKNWAMSMFLSAANAWMCSARDHASKIIQRQISTALKLQRRRKRSAAAGFNHSAASASIEAAARYSSGTNVRVIFQ
jgi:hypothetical protein